MMNLQIIIDKLNLTTLTESQLFECIEIEAVYASDLLSCVMTAAKEKSIWVTLIANINIVAVASLLEIAAIIITEDAQPDLATIERANNEGIVLLSTPEGNYEVAGKLWDLKIRNN